MEIGKVSVNVLKRSVLRQITAKKEEVINGAGIGGDCAVFSFADGELTVSCVQEAALRVPEGMGVAPGQCGAAPEDRGIAPGQCGAAPEGVCADPAGERLSAERRTMTHLVHKCANNLAAKGAEPVAALITLLLPEDLEEPYLKGLMKEADQVCRGLHMQIAGGQTRITAAVTVPYGVVTGIGKIGGQAYRSLKAPAPGQDVVVSKWVGLEGTAYLAGQYREKLLGRYPAWLVEEAEGFDGYLSVIPEAATAMKSGVCAMHDVSEGGIFGALWELAEGAGVGLTIDLKKLPLRQETVEVCEFCNVNPYELLSGGCLLMTSEDGPKLAAALKAEGIPAAVVGKVTDSHDRILRNEDETRYLDRPKEDGIYRIEQ